MYSLGNSTSRCNMANDRFIKRGLYLKKGRKVIFRSSRFGRRFHPMSAPISSLSRVMVKQCLPTSHLEVHLFIYEQRYDYSCALSFIHAHNILFVYRYTTKAICMMIIPILELLVHGFMMPNPHTCPCPYAATNDSHHQQRGL